VHTGSILGYIALTMCTFAAPQQQFSTPADADLSLGSAGWNLNDDFSAQAEPHSCKKNIQNFHMSVIDNPAL
jgi:hypothetical protein